MKQTISVQLTAAVPAAVVALTLGDSTYYKVTGVRLIAENDNATADVQLQLVLSRSTAPLASGSLATEKALQRQDAVIAVTSMSAGSAIVKAGVESGAVMDAEQLFDAASGAYVGLKAVGLESGKVSNVVVEVTMAEVNKTTATTGVYLSQVVTFQGVGT